MRKEQLVGKQSSGESKGKNLEVTEILEKPGSGVSLGRRAKKRRKEHSLGSSCKYVEFEADQGTEKITE